MRYPSVTSFCPVHKRLLLCLTVMLLISPAKMLLAELTPGKNLYRDRAVAHSIVSLIQNRHLLRVKQPLDDKISQRAYESFLKQLDPMKVYFLQSDISEFDSNKNLIDDQVRNGDLSFAYQVFNRFLKRLDDRVAMIPELLKMKHDFEADEEMLIEPDLAAYAKSPEESLDRWRKRIKYDLLVLKDEDVEGDEAIERLTRRYSSYAKRMHQYKSDDLLEIYLSAVTTSYDPHTTYMSPTSLENFDIQMRLNLDGIGAALSMQDGYTVVSRIIPGGAADRQGELAPEDRITSVGEGERGERGEVMDMRLNDVVQLIRGKKGTIVRLGVKAADGSTKVVKIQRDRIELKDSEARGAIITSDKFGGALKPNGKPYRIGVVKLPSFYMDMKAVRQGDPNYKSTTRDVNRILNDFRRNGIDAVMLDLRFNGGGSLTEAINLTGLFIDQGPVVQVKDPGENVSKYDDVEGGRAWDGPLVVVTNKFSASASEILAGAIQDYGRGIVIGDQTTHGKGTVQSLLEISRELFRDTPQVKNLPNFGALKITMQQFYRPDGASTQKQGVVADIFLPSTTNEMEVGEADLDFAVDFGVVPRADHMSYNMVNDAMVGQLREAMNARIGQSEDFAKAAKRIELYKEQKERDFVSLNEEEFFARRKELSAEKEDEENLKKIDENDRPVIDLEDYYDAEVAKITLDYLQLLRGNSLVAQQAPAGR